MPERITDDIFLLQIPLLGGPLKNLNSYLIKSAERNLLIDTGFNRNSCYNAMKSELDALDVDMSRTDIFLTHFHLDHSGLYKRIAHESTITYIGKDDMDIMLDENQLPDIYKFSAVLGLPSFNFEKNVKSNPDIVTKGGDEAILSPVENGCVITVGNRRLEVVHTPGHTPGHMCLFDANDGTMFCGDQIIYDITPNISIWQQMPGALKSYLNGLTYIGSMNVNPALSAHRAPTGNLKERIRELKDHHEKRLSEVFSIVKAQRGLNCYEIASKMAWNIKADCWEEFPPAQQWFATFEAASHLEYLKDCSMVTQNLTDGILVFD